MSSFQRRLPVGKAIAGRFAAEGTRLAIRDINAGTLETATAEWSGISPGSCTGPLTYPDFEAMQRFVADIIPTFGRLDEREDQPASGQRNWNS